MPDPHSLRPALAVRRMLPAAMLVTLLTAVCGSGCATLYRNPVPDNVVEARQLTLRGIDALEHERWEEAELLLAKAIATCPADERAHRRYAEVLWRRGAAEEAVQHLEKSVELSGGDPQRLVQLGELYLARGQTERAWQQAEAAIRAQRKLAAAWALRGDILREQGRLEEALASYHRALSYQPQYPHVQLAAAEVYRRQGRPRRALATLEVLADQYPPGEAPPDVLFLQGLALKAMQRYDDAVDVLTVASRRGEASAEMLFHLSETQLMLGDTANAKLAARAALARAPRDAAIRDLNRRIDDQQRRLTAAVER